MSSYPNSIRVALVGYGYAGKTFHAPLIQSVPGLDLTVVGSSRPDEVRKYLPAAQVIPNPEDAVTRNDVDLVVIASPNESHVPLATAALNAGKHVVVDKPFTNTLAEARGLAELAQAKQKLLSVFHNRRWDSDFLAVKALLAEGRLGEILHFESHFDRFRPEVRDRWRERTGPGAGLWYDLGPHLVDQALELFGLPQKISASLVAQRPGAQIDDWAHVLLDYGRLQVILHGGMLVAGGVPRLTLHGTRGSWLKYGLDVQESQLVRGMHPGDPGWGEDPLPGQFYDGSGGPPQELPVPRGDQSQYYKAIRNALIDGAPNPVIPTQAIAVMAVVETAIQSAAIGQALPLPLTDQERTSLLP
ncbi:MAG TPA: oxidoreductase [Chthoniobacterales bacterium]